MRHYRTITAPPFHLHPLAVSALSPSTILPIFPSPSLLESTWNARRRRNTPPRSFARRRLYGEYAPPFLGPPSSSLSYASNGLYLVRFGTPQTRHGHDLATPTRGTSPFASRRRHEHRRTTPTSPPSSLYPAEPRRHLAVVQDLAGASPENLPTTPTTTAYPLTGTQGEQPHLSPLIHSAHAAWPAWAAPLAGVTPSSARRHQAGQRPQPPVKPI